MIHRQRYEQLIQNQLIDKQTILFLVGPRQAGKTTMLQQLLQTKELKKAQTCLVLGEAFLGQQFANGTAFLDKLAVQYDIADLDYLLIDEAQYIYGIGIILKHLIDMVRAGTYHFKIIASGSGTLEAFRGMTDSLIGRKHILHIYPFDFVEFLTATGHRYAPTTNNIQTYLGLFQTYSLYGGYPRVVLAPTINEKKQVFTGLIQDYLLKDVGLLLAEKEFGNFTNLMKRLATQVGHCLSTQHIATALDISRHQAEKYLYVLENTFLIRIVRARAGGKADEIKKMYKVYFTDLGLLRYLLGITEWIGELKGKVVENMVYLTLAQTIQSYQHIYFRQTKHGGEVDFVVRDEFAGTLMPVESKNTKTDNITRSFGNFCELYVDRITAGIITTESYIGERQVCDKQIHFVPYIALFDEMGKMST